MDRQQRIIQHLTPKNLSADAEVMSIMGENFLENLASLSPAALLRVQEQVILELRSQL